MQIFYCRRDKRIVIVSTVLTLILIGAIIYSTYTYASRDREAIFSFPLLGYGVVIDPGHGGYDPGATRGDIYEKDIVLEISRHIELILGKKGAKVVMTREADEDLLELPAGSRKRRELSNRLKIIARSDADILISIHANWMESPVWSGSQTFYKNDEESKRLALVIQEELAAGLQNTEREAHEGAYFILERSPVPAVIIEVGFISNPEEIKLLLDPEYQKKVALAISKGVFRYFKEK